MDLIVKPLNRTVPDSCCLTISNFCALRDHPSNIFYTGCIYKILSEVQHYLIAIGGNSLGIAMVHTIGMILIVSLYIKIRLLWVLANKQEYKTS